MFVWGYLDKEVPVTAEVTDMCPRCRVLTQQRMICKYRIVHLYVWFRNVNSECMVSTCEACGLVTQLTDEKAKLIRKLPAGDPVPFFDRHGGTVSILLLIVLIAWFVSVVSD